MKLRLGTNLNIRMLFYSSAQNSQKGGGCASTSSAELFLRLRQKLNGVTKHRNVASKLSTNH